MPSSDSTAAFDVEYTFGRPLSTYIGSDRTHARLLILKVRVGTGELIEDMAPAVTLTPERQS